MDIDVTLKNYRCFPDDSPARLTLRTGSVTALIGVNNSGKSSLLRWFFEFRDLFSRLSNPGNNELLQGLRGSRVGFSVLSPVLDFTELFSRENDRDLQLEFALPEDAPRHGAPPGPKRLTLAIQRGSNNFLPTIYVGDRTLSSVGDDLMRRGLSLFIKEQPVASLEHLAEVFTVLTNILYAGPFRNAINLGTQADYFDIQIGQSFIETWREVKSGPVLKHNEAAVQGHGRHSPDFWPEAS